MGKGPSRAIFFNFLIVNVHAISTPSFLILEKEKHEKNNQITPFINSILNDNKYIYNPFYRKRHKKLKKRIENIKIMEKLFFITYSAFSVIGRCYPFKFFKKIIKISNIVKTET